MTYCIGMNLDQGLVFVSDSRTNAGIDKIARFAKMRVFEKPGDRVLVTLSSGNLSVTQHALSVLDLRARDDPSAPSMWNVNSSYHAAGLLGQAMREVRAHDESYLREKNIDPTASFILGGQIAGEAPRLFLVYSEGNFIEALNDTPYFQIGEIKYGKPVLDRLVTRQMSLRDAAKCALVSFDATIRSNLSVGAPLDMLVYRKDSLKVDHRERLHENDAWVEAVNASWSKGLRDAFEKLPDSGLL